jgi:hypothetical protein
LEDRQFYTLSQKNLKSKELLEKFSITHPKLNKPDWNGNTPEDFLNQPNNVANSLATLKSTR